MPECVLIPVPYEQTTSYGHGTKNGPSAILSAFTQVEDFDQELGYELTSRVKIDKIKPVKLARLQPLLAAQIKSNKLPVILGGEHSLTVTAVGEMVKHYPGLSVLQLDAHADLRDSYQGRKDSHACVMRRILSICPAVQVGIRNIAQEEWDFAKQSGQREKIHWAGQPENIETIIKQLSDQVYITIDVDVFDPSVIPAVGTPEPGGLGWYKVLNILEEVAAAKKVVGFDVVELSPRKGDLASEFTAAKLIHKLIGYIYSQ